MVAICGHYVLDLTEAQLPSETTTIVAKALCGAVRIHVPEGWNVIIEGTSVLGRFANQTTVSVERGSGGPSLIINGTAILGSVKADTSILSAGSSV